MYNDFQKLESRINFLEKAILPKEKSGGNYTRQEQAFIRSYIFLVHAEIESFIETSATEKVSKVLKKWKLVRKPSICLKSVLAFLSPEIVFKSADSLDYRIQRTVKHYLAIIRNNHGVKRKNLLSILLPLGLSIKQLDDTWLNIMDEFGKQRGDIAHKSLKIQSIIDPKTERDKVNLQILPELGVVYKLIQKIK